MRVARLESQIEVSYPTQKSTPSPYVRRRARWHASGRIQMERGLRRLHPPQRRGRLGLYEIQVSLLAHSSSGPICTAGEHRD